MATATEIAQWMVDRIMETQYETQEEMVSNIEEASGPEWVYDNGNPAISPKVLSEFRELHAGTIEWDRSERAWTTT